jgi:tetratricopeptide (TPR) repeat protein
MDDLTELELGKDCAKYDLEEYTLPPVIRKVLKTSKMGEVFEIRTSRKDKIVPAFPDSN